MWTEKTEELIGKDKDIRKVTFKRVLSEPEIRKMLKMREGEDITSAAWFPGNDMLVLHSEECHYLVDEYFPKI